MINNRQAGRRRGRGGNGTGGNAPRQGGQGGRADNGNRIDSRARGNASQLYEKYKNLAADAQRQGDRVNTEYYLQFADHYFRVLSDQRGRFEEQQPRRQPFDGEMESEDDFGDEGEPIRAGEQGEQPRQDATRQDRAPRQSDGQRGESRGEPRAERPRRWEREERAPRAPEFRSPEPVSTGTSTAEAGGSDQGAEVGGQHRADPVVPGENLAVRAEAVIAADAPLAVDTPPRRRGRPRREPVEAPASESNGVEAERLPPALGAAAANDAAFDDSPRPRRRRVRTAASDAVVD